MSDQILGMPLPQLRWDGQHVLHHVLADEVGLTLFEEDNQLYGICGDLRGLRFVYLELPAFSGLIVLERRAGIDRTSSFYSAQQASQRLF